MYFLSRSPNFSGIIKKEKFFKTVYPVKRCEACIADRLKFLQNSNKVYIDYEKKCHDLKAQLDAARKQCDRSDASVNINMFLIH